VTIRWHLGRDGRLLGQPEVFGQQVTPEIKPWAEWAMRAVRECQPFKLRYNVWKTIVWDFDPTAISN
jgi:hypothetical protein